MRRKMKSFSGFFSGRFPATSLSATVCLLFCTQMLTFFPTSLCLFLSLAVSILHICTDEQSRFSASGFGFVFAGRQARQDQREEGEREGAWFSIGMWQVFCLNIV